MTGDVEQGASAPAERDVRGRVAGAATFVAVGLIGSNFIRMAANVLLARILVPEDFGVMALVSSVLIALGLFSDMGIVANIIHSKRGENPVFLDTAWTFGIARGVLLWSICIGLAWPLAAFYGAPELRFILPVSGLTAFMSGINSTRVAVYQRQLRMKAIEVMNLVCYAISVVVMLGWGLVWPSVWALVAGGVVNGFLLMCWSHIFLTGHRDRLCWDRSCVSEIFGFGRWVFVSTAASFIAERSDNLFIGRLATISELGVFGFAVGISSIPSLLAAHLSGKVIFPLYAKYASEGTRDLGRKIRSARGIMLPSFILMALGTAVACDPFFRYLYTEQYQDAAWMCQLLCVATYLNVIKGSSDRAFLAIGNSKNLAISNILGGFVKLVVAVPACMHFGVVGFIVGIIIGAIANEIVTIILLARNQIYVLWQDLRYCGIAALLGVVCIGAPKVIAPMTGIPAELLQYVISFITLSGLAWWSLNRLRLGLKAAYAG